MTLKVISAEQVLFEGKVTSVTLPGVEGSFTVLKNHASIISVLSEGDLFFSAEEGKREELHVKGGIVDVDNNVVSVCIY